MAGKLLSLDIDFKSLDKLARGFKGYRLALQRELKRAVAETVLDIEREAKEACPVDTGRLRASITPDVPASDQGIVGTNVEYAPHVEYGTENMDAQPFMEPAYLKGGKAARKHFEDAFKRLQKMVNG